MNRGLTPEALGVRATVTRRLSPPLSKLERTGASKGGYGSFFENGRWCVVVCVGGGSLRGAKGDGRDRRLKGAGNAENARIACSVGSATLARRHLILFSAIRGFCVRKVKKKNAGRGVHALLWRANRDVVVRSFLGSVCG